MVPQGNQHYIIAGKTLSAPILCLLGSCNSLPNSKRLPSKSNIPGIDASFVSASSNVPLFSAAAVTALVVLHEFFILV